jgi:hypothetical protein
MLEHDSAKVVRQMSRARILRVAIDAPIMPGMSGEVPQAVMGLLHALGQLDDGSEFYTVVVESEQQLDWLKHFVAPNQQL